MAINPFKSGRAVGKGVKYLTELGSKIGKKLGGAVDNLGATTRNTQASVIKGARGVRDAASEARRGYNVGRKGGLHLSDVETPNQIAHHTKMANKGMASKIGDHVVNKRKYLDMNKGPANKMPGGGAIHSPSPIRKEHMNSMRKGVSGGKGKPNKVYVGGYEKTPDGKFVIPDRKKEAMNDFIKNRMNNLPPPKFSKIPSGMSKNRRAGLITGGAIAAGYGVHKGNDALQNHYRQQKNAARGGM